MKTDPTTEESYSKDWERDLNMIQQAGFSYGYFSVLDLKTGEWRWQVDAMKDEGPRVVIEMPTLREAVAEFKRRLKVR